MLLHQNVLGIARLIVLLASSFARTKPRRHRSYELACTRGEPYLGRPKKVLWLLPYTVGSRGSTGAVRTAKRHLGIRFSG